MGNEPQPSLHTPEKKTPREERNKQTNPFPLLAWHLLTALPLLIREAAGIISNKPLLMKFRAADPGGAPRHCFSETLIKFTARRCFWLGWRQSSEAARAGHGRAGGGPWGKGSSRRGTPHCPLRIWGWTEESAGMNCCKGGTAWPPQERQKWIV